MQKIISIPEPCYENWNEMTPNAQGRHCGACAKTVVDFTTWETPEIIFYLEQHAALNVCGRFNAAQLKDDIPMPREFVRIVSAFPISALKKAAAVLIFAFLLSADSSAQMLKGKTEQHTTRTTAVGATRPNLNASTRLVGEPALSGAPIVQVKDSTKKPVAPQKKPVCNPVMMGAVAMPVNPQPKPPVKKKTEVITGRVAPKNGGKADKV